MRSYMYFQRHRHYDISCINQEVACIAQETASTTKELTISPPSLPPPPHTQPFCKLER